MCLVSLLLLWPLVGSAAEPEIWHRGYRNWTLAEAVRVLNDSPWARRETFTRVVGGIGSGVRGEKELYHTFFVRLLSARPIREAYNRVHQLQAGYDGWGHDERRRFDLSSAAALDMDVRDWIVVAVGFRSNDRNQEMQVRKFFEIQTTESLQNTTFLSTPRFPQVRLAAYFAPREESVGAKFVFPRRIEDVAVLAPSDPRFSFELDVPGAEPGLRVTFSPSRMILEDKPVY